MALLVGMAFLASGCKPEKADKDSGKLKVVATTTMIKDLALQIGGEDIQIDGIMKPGGDPHLYTPTPADAKMVARADVVLTNGLKLEGWIEDLVRNAGGEATTVVVTKGISPMQDPAKTNYPDPHVWHDVALWKVAAENVRDSLVKIDAKNAEAHKKRATAYIAELDALDEWVKSETQKIPAEKRVLITSHDAFNYYGRAYKMDVVGIQGLSTEAEAGAQDVARIVELVKSKKIPSLFVETSVNQKLIEQVSRETGTSIGGSLYSDSLGPDGTPEGTYKGMIESNTRQLVKALSGK